MSRLDEILGGHEGNCLSYAQLECNCGLDAEEREIKKLMIEQLVWTKGMQTPKAVLAIIAKRIEDL